MTPGCLDDVAQEASYRRLLSAAPYVAPRPSPLAQDVPQRSVGSLPRRPQSSPPVVVPGVAGRLLYVYLDTTWDEVRSRAHR